MKMLVPPGFTVAAIATARAAASLPAPPEAAPALTLVRQVSGVYTRHFAGESRATRDPEMLGELIARLEDARARLVTLQARSPAAMAPHVQAVAQQLALYTFEQDQLRRVGDGQPPEVRASWLAARTNEAILLYRAHFEQRDRASRRVGLARRMVRTFERIELEMATDDENRPLVERLLGHVRRELDAILLAHAAVDRLDALGHAAQAEIDLYVTAFASRDRATWDLRQLADLCDRLVEIAWQLPDLPPSDTLTTLTGAVTTALDAYEFAWGEARTSQMAAL